MLVLWRQSASTKFFLNLLRNFRGVVFSFKTKVKKKSSNSKTNTNMKLTHLKKAPLRNRYLSLQVCSLSESRYLSRLKIPANLTVWLWNSQIQAKFCFCSSSIYALYCSLQLEKFFGCSENIFASLGGREGACLLIVVVKQPVRGGVGARRSVHSPPREKFVSWTWGFVKVLN